MESIYYIFLGLGASFCAYHAMVSKHLLPSTLYLAVVSALATVILYLLGAYELAVIELSVGAGLVTVLLVYALSVIGEDALDPTSIIPKPFAFLLVAGIGGMVIWMAYPLTMHPNTNGQLSLANVLWKQRALDVWVQVALIFSGVMGVLGLLSENPHQQEIEKHENLVLTESDAVTILLEQEVRA